MDTLTMSLDEIIEKSGRGKGRGRGGRAGRGRGGVRGGSRPTPVIAKPKQAATTLSSMSAQKAALTAAGITTGTKLRIGNLDSGVSEQDIQELFGEIGDLKSVEVVTNAAGVSKGLSFVVYKRKADAQKALETYNGVPLDNKPLKITMMTNSSAPPASTAASIKIDTAVSRGTRTVTVTKGTAAPTAGRGRGDRGVSRGAARGGARGGGRGAGRGAASGRGGRGKKDAPKPTMEDLDADLENYRSSMET